MALCQCGCGTEVARRYVRGHNPSPRRSYLSSPTAKQRLYSKLVAGPNGCLIWTGTRIGRPDAQYGKMLVDGRHIYTHRLAYQLHTGDLLTPKDVVHHVCEQRLCANPNHLRKMSLSEHTKMHRAQRKAKLITPLMV